MKGKVMREEWRCKQDARRVDGRVMVREQGDSETD